MKVHLFTDGGSRGNPGPAAYAFLILDSNGNTLRKGSRYIGTGTNNVAEYSGLLAALKEASSMGAGEVVVTMDSELVVRQMQGHYSVKAEKLRPLYEEALTLARSFSQFSIRHVRREDPIITQVDAMVNEELDVCTKRR